ncbi:reverse transcriptase domain-containing protein [Tanacetum coccineum]
MLGHKISKAGIEVDRAKVDVIAKLPHLTTVKEAYRSSYPSVVPDWNLPFELMCDASDFAIGAVLGQRKIKHFQPIHYASKTMTEAQIHYTTRKKEMLAVVYAFEKFRPYLVLSKSIVYTDHSALKYLMNKKQHRLSQRLLRWVLLLQEFDITLRDKRRIVENLAATILSRLEILIWTVFKKQKTINDIFLFETLTSYSSKNLMFAGVCKLPCRGDILSSKECQLNKRGSFLRTLNMYYWDASCPFVLVRIKSFDGVCMGKKLLKIFKALPEGPPGANS